jgi:type II secretory pathway pseudopilin PulG
MQRRVRHRSLRESGYTYVGLLIVIAVISLLSASSLRLGVMVHRRVAEQELLDRGYRLTLALESFARQTPAGQNPYPQAIEDLLRDPRFPNKVVRHLRRIEFDPMTGKPVWGTVAPERGRGIGGFYSLSDQAVLRKDFKPPFQEFADLPTYRDWVFVGGLGEDSPYSRVGQQ